MHNDNDITFLEEEIDEDYEPTQEGKIFIFFDFI